MACIAQSLTGSSISKAAGDSSMKKGGFRRSSSSNDLRHRAAMRRSYSDNHLCYSVNCIRASTTQPKIKNSRSAGIFSFQLSEAVIPDPLKSFLFDPERSKEMDMDENTEQKDHESEMLDENAEQKDHESEMLVEEKRANWMERLMEIRSRWRGKQQKDNLEDDIEDGHNSDGCETEDGCGVYYDDDAESGMNFVEESFSRLLRRVSWSDTKHFSQLAFLCNMAYVIPQIKAKDLRRYYGLDFVTSSLVKKAEAEDMKAKSEQVSARVPIATSATTETNLQKPGNYVQKRVVKPSVAYEIAASAATYVQSRAKDLLSLGSEPQLALDEVISQQQEDHLEEEEERSLHRVYKSEMAAQVAASTMTAVVAAGEKQKQETARDLQSLHSSPCEWFICDDSSIYTRCFVIQGSDSMASWQANLFFEPTKFEGTDVLVHRGIYEAAKGIYEQFMPEIIQHLNRFGNRAKLQFTGHSLGGSLALLVNLMLLARKVVNPSALLPVVTFGSPFVFCGGHKILDDLGLDENHVHCVIMHRDIVPRAFSCNYPDHVVQVLKRLNGTFRSHPCLNKNKLLYSPMGKIFILQPDEKSSPPHPLLPMGSAIYTLESTGHGTTRSALKAFLNSPHPLETLSDPAAYGSDGTIVRDHDSSNYLKAVNDVIRQHTRQVVRKARNQRHLLWPLLTSQSPHAWGHERNAEASGLASRLTNQEIMTGV